MLTNDGQTYWRDKSLDLTDARIDSLAVGVGTTVESASDSSLSNEVFRATLPGDENILRFVPQTDVEKGIYGRCVTQLEVTGGLQITSGTAITESAIIADGVTDENGTPIGDDVCVYRRTFDPIGISEGLSTTLRHAYDVDSS